MIEFGEGPTGELNADFLRKFVKHSNEFLAFTKMNQELSLYVFSQLFYIEKDNLVYGKLRNEN